MPMTEIRIDLYSDTQTRPTPAMRKAMAEAEVGDEQRGEDPTVNKLNAMVAKLLGKDGAVFLPSGTMCNQIAILVHCRPGDEVIADKSAHIINSEAGGPATFAGVMVRPLDGKRGVYTVDQMEAAVRGVKRNAPRSTLVVAEQTANSGGGTVWPLETLREVATTAKRHGLLMHMDGARLMNAVIASGVAAKNFAEPFDSLWIDLSKGLGCPVGAVLAGGREFIAEAWTWKQRMGGAMRQAGVIAAAGVHALEHHVDRMAEDHENARAFAEAIANLPGIAVEEGVDSNMVFFNVEGTGLPAAEIHNRLLERGIRIGAYDRYRMRAVTHLDVNREAVVAAAEAVREVARGAAG